MVKVAVLKVCQPNIFVGQDLDLFERISQSCLQTRNSHSLLLSCGDITPRMVLLYEHNKQLVRIRVLNIIDPNTFRCLFIDHGRIEEIKKHRLFVLPLNQLQMDPAVKLFKITGVVPAGLKISASGAEIRAGLTESKEWIPAAYKFVCHIFRDRPYVNVSYIRQLNSEKALVDVFVTYGDQRESLGDLLVREKYAFCVDDSDCSLSMLSKEHDESAESVSRLIEEMSEADRGVVQEAEDGSDRPAVAATLDEISAQVLAVKVQAWIVQRTVDGTYEYRAPPRPVLSYQQDRTVAPFLKEAMLHHGTKALLLIQSMMLPSIVRGVNTVAIAPPKKGKSMGLLMPILQKVASRPTKRVRSFNPLVVVLCTSWTKVTEMADSARLFLDFIGEAAKTRRPRVVAAHAGRAEKKIMIPILEGCDILIVTPKCLLRLLKTHEFFKLNELELLAVDDAEDVIAQNLEELREILLYRRTGAAESGLVVQVAATATLWTAGLQSFIENEMGAMFAVVVNNPIEVAVSQKLKQKIIEFNKSPIDLYERILTYLEMTEASIHRTVIFASDDLHISAIFRFLSQKVSYDLRMMLGSMTGAEMGVIEREWNQFQGHINMPILLVSDEALGRSDISIFNAHTILHADLNPAMFGCRINFLRDHFSKLPFLEPPATGPYVYHSYMFLCPSEIQLTHANFLYKFLGRCLSDRPVWLQEKAIDYVLTKEKSKVVNDICQEIKAKGECRFPACNKRHIVLADVDRPQLPNRGQIKFRLLHLRSPSNFFVRILEHKVVNESQNSEYKSKYTSLKMGIMKYFSDPRNVQGASARLVLPGLIAAIRLKDILERVLVLKVRAKTSTKVDVKLIDHGSTMTVEQSDLLSLPEDLASVPAQAVEVFVTGIRPLDEDQHFHKESSEFAQQFLDGKDLYAVIMLCIGKTLWLDAVTQLVHHKATNISVYDKNLSVELVEQDFAERNPGHIQKLIRLCTGKVDIWNSEPQSQPTNPIPIMRMFSYTEEPLTFEELILGDDDQPVENECTLERVLPGGLLVLSQRETRQAILHLQREVGSLIESIETVPSGTAVPGTRVLFCGHGDVWMRGCVLTTSGAISKVLAVDWGLVEEHGPTDVPLHRLPAEYAHLPCHLVLADLRDLVGPLGTAAVSIIKRSCGSGQPLAVEATSVAVPTSLAVLLGPGTINQGPGSLQTNKIDSASNQSENITTGSSQNQNITTGSSQNQNIPHGSSQTSPESLPANLRIYSVTVRRRGPRGPEDLVETLVRARSAAPSPSWLHTVLPEAAPPLSRLARLGSVPHLGVDLLCSLSGPESDRRLKIASNIERIVSRLASTSRTAGVVRGNIEAVLNTLAVLLHFVEETPLVLPMIRGLGALVGLAYDGGLPVEGPPTEQCFSLGYVCEVLLSYPDLLSHLLSHLQSVLRGDRPTDASIFLDLLEPLTADARLVRSLLGEDMCPPVMATAVGALVVEEGLFVRLGELVQPLCVQARTRETPVMAGLLRQVTGVLGDGGHGDRVIMTGLAVVASLEPWRPYRDLLQESGLFCTLVTVAVARWDRAAVAEASLEVAAALWRVGAVDRAAVRARRLSGGLRAALNLAPREGGARLLADLLLEESASCPGTQDRLQARPRGALPDPDASDWMAAGKDASAMRRRRRCRRKLMGEGGPGSDGSDEGEGGLSGPETGESSSDLEGEEATFVARGNRNPADEDNVINYDRP